MTESDAQIRTAPHELEGNLIYAEHGEAPYWGFRRFVNQLEGGGLYDIELASSCSSS